MTSDLNPMTPPVPSYLHAVRLATAGLAAVSAVIYFLIGFGVLKVVEVGPGDPSLLWFGLPAGLAFVFGVLVMIRSERMTLWALGAVFQVFAISVYFGVAHERTPPYETWGSVLVVTQMLILVALVFLLARYPKAARTPGAPKQRP